MNVHIANVGSAAAEVSLGGGDTLLVDASRRFLIRVSKRQSKVSISAMALRRK